RFGSGSTGLCFASAADLGDAVSESAKSAKGGDRRASSNGLDAVVVQKLLPGPEYGVDGVYPLDGEGSLLGVLARRKDRMRGGDTDVATTVAPRGLHRLHGSTRRSPQAGGPDRRRLPRECRRHTADHRCQPTVRWGIPV